MLTLLPFLSLITIILLLKQVLKETYDLRLVILLGAVLWGVILTLITEALSLLQLFNRSGLAAAWGAVLIGSGVGAALRWQGIRLPQRPSGFSLLHWLQLAGIAGLAALTGAIAIIAAPNNWDSMVYHLSRAAHWLQNSRVAFYPTSILRQLYLPPWSEYLLAHLLALGTGDRFTQIPQWLAFFGSVMGISLLAKQLGTRPSGQVLVSLAAATLPMGILQATTTQNDAVVTFWLVCLAVLIFHAQKQTHPGWILAIGAALGLALLTKSTAYLFALPFMLYYVIQGLKRHGLCFWRPVLLITLTFLALNLPHFSRNYSLFGHPLGPQAEIARYHNDPISIKGTVSNIIRNLGLYLGSIEPANQVVNRAIEDVHGWMGMGVNDPRYTWSDHLFRVETPRAHEDTTGSSLHVLLAAASLIVLVIKRRELESRQFILFALILFTGFLIFCAYLRWQIWHPRLHLPLLMLSMAWVGLLDQISRRWVIWSLSLVLVVLVMPVFYFNPSKPLAADYTIFNLPRREVMIMRKNLVVPYIESVNFLLDERCYQVGLYIPNEEWEYPFWSLYQDSAAPFRLEHVNVGNESADLAMSTFTPCAIIATQSTGEQFALNDGKVYDLTWSMDPVYVYTRE